MPCCCDIDRLVLSNKVKNRVGVRAAVTGSGPGYVRVREVRHREELYYRRSL